MFKIVICEDNSIFREYLSNYISKIFSEINKEVEILEFTRGEDLVENYPEKVDIFFLDIEMDKLTGMDVARKIREVESYPEIIFTTAVSSYLQEGYEVRAYRYLIKPFKEEDLKKHLLACINEIVSKRENYLIVQDKGKVYKIAVDKITYIEVFQRDITIHTLENTYTVKMSINSAEKELNKYNFFRCHRSYLVNMKHVQYINSNIAIINGNEVPVSRYRVSKFKQSLACSLGKMLC